MEFSQSTKRMMSQVAQWVCDHPDKVKDNSLSKQDVYTIILRILGDPTIVNEYESDNKTCTYIFQSGPRRSEECGTPVSRKDAIHCSYHDNPIFTGELVDVFGEAISLALSSVQPEKVGCGAEHIPGEMCARVIASSGAVNTRTIDVTTSSTEEMSYKQALNNDCSSSPKAETPVKAEEKVWTERFRVHLYRDNPPLFRIDGTKIIIIIKQYGVSVVGAVSDTEDSFRKLTEEEVIHCGQMGFLMDVSALGF
jgi:hypothetical protein